MKKRDGKRKSMLCLHVRHGHYGGGAEFPIQGMIPTRDYIKGKRVSLKEKRSDDSTCPIPTTGLSCKESNNNKGGERGREVAADEKRGGILEELLRKRGELHLAPLGGMQCL